MNQYVNAGQGLKKVFIAAIGAIVCAVLMIIPVINLIASIGAIVFLVISLLGLNQAGKEIDGCKTAFILTIVNLVVRILAVPFAGSAVLSFIFTLVGTIISFLVTYYVCTSVSAALSTIGAGEVG